MVSYGQTDTQIYINWYLVDHTPHIDNRQDHLIHHDDDVEEQGGDGGESEVEQQHEEIVCGSSIKNTSLESLAKQDQNSTRCDLYIPSNLLKSLRCSSKPWLV